MRLSNNRKLSILSGYRVCDQNPTLGSRTSYNQQLRLLTAAGHLNPDPRKHFFADLIPLIQQWHANRHEVIVCLDINEDTNITNPLEDLGLLLLKTDLVDLHQYRYPTRQTPETHQRGSTTIDIILGSPTVAQAIRRVFYLPHGEPLTLSGDHRTLGVDIDTTILFGNKLPTMLPTSHRGVNSNAYPTVPEFCKAVVEKCENQQLFDRIDSLLQYTEFSANHHSELEEIDQQLTEILVRTNQKFRKKHTLPWSPTLSTAYFTHRYWMLSLTQKRTERNYSTQLRRIEQRINQTPINHGSINRNIRVARQELRTIQRQAAAVRAEFLDSLLTTAKQMKDKSRQRLIYQLRQAKLNRRCFAAVKSILKPRSPGGLTHLLLPDANDSTKWNTIDDALDVEKNLLSYCQSHFATAHGSPFTVPPLSDLLQTHSDTPFATALINGTANINELPLDNATKAFLRHQRRPPHFSAKPQPLNFEKLTEGFKKWPEKTSTSPSGRHLGVYKSLLKDVHRKKDKQNPNSSQSSTQSDDTKRRGVDVMTLVYKILQLSVTHTHTLQRWCTIWNLFLEKDPGQPKINRLRALHLLEADLNLLWKYYSAQGFFKTAENHNLLIDNQGGCRKGFSAIDMACKKAIVYEWMRLMRANGINIDNDLEACFDNMVEACHSLACHSKGADIQYLRLHAQTQKLQRYYVKHAQGISTDHNSFSPDSPWYGAGQGTGDAALRYTTQSNGMIQAYRNHSWNLEISNPTNTIHPTQDIDAYADDTTLMNGTRHDNHALLRIQAQQNLNSWSDIVQCTGGALNPPKCGWAHFRWNFDSHGRPAISTVKHPIGLKLPDRKGNIHQLKQHLPTTAVRILGVHIAMDGNMKQEYKILADKANQYKKVLYRCNFTTSEAKTIYKQCYIPALVYPLPATAMDPIKIQATQDQVTALFLSKMGYSRLFPRRVVFAPANIGGLGFRHIGYEQDIQKIVSILKHGRAKTHHWPVIQCLLETYQLYAGICDPILEDTGPLPWCPDGWVTSLRQFLHQTKGKIILATQWTPQARRTGDRHIMNDARSLSLSRAEFNDANNVRIFLRVNMLSEITDHHGNRLLAQYYTPVTDIEQNPNPSGSTLTWPTQLCPGTRARRTWCSLLSQLYLTNRGLSLRQPLGPWNSETVESDWQWHWKMCPTTQRLYQRTGTHWKSYAPLRHTRTCLTYDTPDNHGSLPTTNAVPVTVSIS